MNKEAKIFATISGNAGYKTNGINETDKYNNMLFLCRGKEIEIETDYLFLNQFNTTPIENVSEIGLRLYAKDIKSLRLENCTFDKIKKKLTEQYKKAWNQSLTDRSFSCWENLLGISKGMKQINVIDKNNKETIAWATV